MLTVANSLNTPRYDITDLQNFVLYTNKAMQWNKKWWNMFYLPFLLKCTIEVRDHPKWIQHSNILPHWWTLHQDIYFYVQNYCAKHLPLSSSITADRIQVWTKWIYGQTQIITTNIFLNSNITHFEDNLSLQVFYQQNKKSYFVLLTIRLRMGYLHLEFHRSLGLKFSF